MSVEDIDIVQKALNKKHGIGVLTGETTCDQVDPASKKTPKSKTREPGGGTEIPCQQLMPGQEEGLASTDTMTAAQSQAAESEDSERYRQFGRDPPKSQDQEDSEKKGDEEEQMVGSVAESFLEQSLTGIIHGDIVHEWRSSVPDCAERLSALELPAGELETVERILDHPNHPARTLVFTGGI